MKRSIVSFGIFAGIASTACNQHTLKGIEQKSEIDDGDTVELNVNKNVDILFVIDNSGSMGEEQANLAANFQAFIQKLEDPDVQANYRIAVTTTDNGNPLCGGTTTPEGGAFVLESCRERLDHFLFTGTPMVDARDTACLDICQYDGDQLQIQPTTTDLDLDPKPRPWLENIAGETNLPAGIGTTDAFECFGPQGVDGCGFESPLESMYKALSRANNQDEASYGFLRDDALLAVIFVTDEVDCSHRNEHAGIFTDNKAFWSDPSEPYPTSAVCWNAGVECTGGPGQYEGCRSADKDQDGNLTDDPDAAVLHPVSRYVDFLDGIRAAKHSANADAEVIVGVITGVPDGYQDGVDIVYADSPDAKFMKDFGIGPGCTGDGGEQTALPPVRLKEFAESFGDRNLFSVCSDDYTPALEELANTLIENFQAPCFKKCARDADLATAGIQPSCVVEEHVPGGITNVLEPCTVVDGELVPPSVGDAACYGVKTDDGETTPVGHDDMSQECIDDGWNLEFEIVRALGQTAVGGATVEATCEISEFPQIDCPNLP